MKKNVLESTAAERDSRVFASRIVARCILSSAGHVKSCVNLPGPSGKAKYIRETDSEPVP